MKHILTATTLAAIFAGSVAIAESHMAAEGSDDTQMAQSSKTDHMDHGPFGASEDMENLQIFASDFIGKRIYATETEVGETIEAGAEQEWEDLGEVNDLLLGQDGQVDYAILGIGGFLGIGERDVLVNLDALQITRSGDDATDYFLVVNATQEQIEAAPEFDSTMITEAGQAVDSAGQTAEDAGQDAEQAVENAAQDAENAAESTGVVLKNATEEAGDAVENAGEAIEETTDEATTAN